MPNGNQPVSTLQGWEITSRASEQARAAGMGAWRYTMRLSRKADRNSLKSEIVGVVVGLIVGTASVLFLWRWKPTSPVVWAVALVMSAVGLAIVAFHLLEAVRKYRAGIRGVLLAHVHDGGLVLERTQGPLHVVPLDEASLQFVAWDAGADERRREQLWITGLDGTVGAIEAWSDPECNELALLAAHFGLDPEPREIDAVDHARQPRML